MDECKIELIEPKTTPQLQSLQTKSNSTFSPVLLIATPTSILSNRVRELWYAHGLLSSGLVQHAYSFFRDELICVAEPNSTASASLDCIVIGHQLIEEWTIDPESTRLAAITKFSDKSGGIVDKPSEFELQQPVFWESRDKCRCKQKAIGNIDSGANGDNKLKIQIYRCFYSDPSAHSIRRTGGGSDNFSSSPEFLVLKGIVVDGNESKSNVDTGTKKFAGYSRKLANPKFTLSYRAGVIYADSDRQGNVNYWCKKPDLLLAISNRIYGSTYKHDEYGILPSREQQVCDVKLNCGGIKMVDTYSRPTNTDLANAGKLLAMTMTEWNRHTVKQWTRDRVVDNFDRVPLSTTASPYFKSSKSSFDLADDEAGCSGCVVS